MPAITIRDVPDETRDELAARAARSGRSLQEYLRRELIDMAQRADTEALVARIRARKATTSTTLDAAAIVEHLHTERR